MKMTVQDLFDKKFDNALMRDAYEYSRKKLEQSLAEQKAAAVAATTSLAKEAALERAAA